VYPERAGELAGAEVAHDVLVRTLRGVEYEERNQQLRTGIASSSQKWVIGDIMGYVPS
jgi:hypothetical protein